MIVDGDNLKTFTNDIRSGNAECRPVLIPFRMQGVRLASVVRCIPAPANRRPAPMYSNAKQGARGAPLLPAGARGAPLLPNACSFYKRRTAIR